MYYLLDWPRLLKRSCVLMLFAVLPTSSLVMQPALAEDPVDVVTDVMKKQSSPRAADFPPVINSPSEADQLPMPAEDAAVSMKLPEGFHATVFALEPDVQNPIAMAWDERQRLWIAENYTYSDRTQRFDLSMRDRVLIFEDSDKDGKADTRKVFLDDVQMLTSVEIGHGGVYLMCPPQLLFVPDADGDDVPDGPPQVLLDGFEIGESSRHNFANGLRWGPDGWLYGRCGHSCPGRIGQPGTPADQRIPIDGGIWRYHPTRQVVEVLCHGTVNPWGHDWDKNGELFFINTVIGHLWHMVPGSHFKESFGESENPFVYERMDMIADHYHFDTRGNWTNSRDGKANDFGGGHAHVGMLIYHGDRWPKQYQDKLMTINMHGSRVNVERLDRTTSGYVGRHEPDFLISRDPFFRGTDLSVGPDGDVYLIDWSDTGECHEHTGVHRTSGRIFKISHPGKSTRVFTKPMCLAGTGELPKLWRDYQDGKISSEDLRQLAEHDDEHVRVWAIRLLTDFWPLDWMTGPNPQAEYPVDSATTSLLLQMASDDPSGLVVRALVSTLQRMPIEARSSLAEQILSRQEFSDQRDLALLCWYGLMPLVDRAPDQLVEIAAKTEWPLLSRWIARGLSSRYREHSESFERLLQAANKMPPASQSETLIGIHEGLQGYRKAALPRAWNEFCRLPGVHDSDRLRDLNILFGDGRALDAVRDLVLNDRADMKVRISALETLIDAKPNDLRRVCEQVLNVQLLNGIALRGLSFEEDSEIAKLIVRRYRNFLADDRQKAIETLLSRKTWAMILLDAIDQGQSSLSTSDLSASQARQILTFDDADLTARLGEVWGQLRETSEERRIAIEDWKKRLDKKTLAAADLSSGRVLFEKTCAGCHMLYGQGNRVGPDLTGAQRGSLEYLLENILDPSAVVGKDYRMSKVLTVDGRILSGLVISRDANRLVLRTATEPITIADDDIELIEESALSAMPDGLLHNLTDDQVAELIAYLMHPTQVFP
ncbi:PVC-type heme-binding CxxCH protein [Neorhodopirellula pilleata]|uniref:Cytochrome c n=1 Tax=Neorhodopirellula pilleata TaxID=2714738 RepID=A0A5C6AA82_9BACT|nr:PVC-type heme-binding CxxCH protein [Neorhodopirellula pilleata]TWT96310.1 Cytochrome c [Neorhodopirellula pilleata]